MSAMISASEPLNIEIKRISLIKRISISSASIHVVQAPVGYGKTLLARQLAHHWEDQDVVFVSGFSAEKVSTALHSLNVTHIIIDDSDALSRGAHREIEEWLNKDSGRRIAVLCCRKDISPLYGRTFADGRGNRIDVNDMRFSSSEVERIFPEKEVMSEQIFLEAMGWPIAVSLLKNGSIYALASLRYILEDAVGEGWRELCELSFVKSWDAGLIHRLFPLLPVNWFVSIIQSSVPLIQSQSGELQPLPLVRRILAVELLEDFTRITGVFEKIILLDLSDDEIDFTLEFAIANNLSDAGRIVLEKMLKRFLENWRFEEIVSIYERVPRGWIDADLASDFGLALMEVGRSSEAEVLLRSLQSKLPSHPRILSALAMLAGRRGKADVQLELIRRAKTSTAGLSNQILLQRQEIYALINTGNVSQAEELARIAVEKCEAYASATSLAEALHTYQIVLYKQGRIREAQPYLLRAQKIYENVKYYERSLLTINDLADSKRLLGEAAEILDELRKAIVTSRLYFRSAEPLLLESLADALMTLGKFDEALHIYESLPELCKQYSVEVICFRAYLKSAECRTYLGDFLASERILGNARSSFFVDQNLYNYYFGIINFHRNMIEKAVVYLDIAFHSEISIDRRLRCAFILHDIENRRGNAGLMYKDFIDKYGDRYCLSTLVKHDLYLTDSNILELKPVIKISTFGYFRISYLETSLKFAFSKAIELFIYLIIHPSSRKESIIDQLWQYEDNKRSADYFKVALHQVRSVLKEATGLENPVKLVNKSYKICEEIVIEADFLEINRALTQRNPRVLEAVLQSYNGEFMDGYDSEWINENRIKFHEDILASSLTLADLTKESQPSIAIWALEKSISIDALYSEAYPQLIKLYELQNEFTLSEKYRRLLKNTVKNLSG